MGFKRKIIFICGLPGSGKTTFAKKLSDYLSKDSILISQDWHIRYSTKERKERLRKINKTNNLSLIRKEENPVNWYDYKQFAKDLKTLQKTGKLKIKDVWNQYTGEKDLGININLEGERIIICEGIYLLHKDMAKCADLIIYLDYPLKESIKRQEKRDSYRNSKEYSKHKRYIAKEYTVPYLKQNLKSANIIIKAEDYEKDRKIKKISDMVLKKIRKKQDYKTETI